ncbi:hypothetical protein ACHAWT_004753 [Skeletonema menzelii]
MEIIFSPQNSFPANLFIQPPSNIQPPAAPRPPQPTATLTNNNIVTMFARSAVRMARYDVSPHLSKWWKGVRPDDGQVTRHLSPFEQQIVMPWIKTFPKRAYAKFSDSGPYLVATTIIVYGTAALSDAADAAQDKSYRY